MDSLEKKFLTAIGLIATTCVVLLVYLFSIRTNRQGQCSALNGVYLKLEETCVKLEKIKLEQ